MVVVALTSTKSLGFLDAVKVMRGHDDYVCLLQVDERVLHAVVVAGVRVLDAVPYRTLEAALSSQLALLVHVGSSDQLKADVVPEYLCGGNLVLDNLPHSLEVALVAVHDNDLAPMVVGVGHLLPEAFDGSLHEGLLGVNVQFAVSLGCVAA